MTSVRISGMRTIVSSSQPLQGEGGGGGGGGAETCYPGKIRGLVTLRYRKVVLKLTNSVLKRNIFTM